MWAKETLFSLTQWPGLGEIFWFLPYPSTVFLISVDDNNFWGPVDTTRHLPAKEACGSFPSVKAQEIAVDCGAGFIFSVSF